MSIIKIILKSIAFIIILSLFSCAEEEPTTTAQIIEKHINKIGVNLLGKSIKTLILVSEAAYEDKSTVTTTSRFEFPTKLHQNELYAGQLQDYILNGDLGYSIKNNMQLKTLEPFHIKSLQENAHLTTFYRWEERGWQYEYKNKESIDNAEHFVLEGKNDSLRLINKVFINTNSYLIKRMMLRSSTFNASSDFNNYFKKDGFQYPNETITDFGTYTIESTVKTFEINPKLDSSIFEVVLAIE